MIAIILLALILGIVITSFIILNNKLNIIQDYLVTIIRKLKSINSVVDVINNSNCHLLNRFNDFILRYNESKGLLESKYNINVKYFNEILTDITNKINEINEHIKVEHIVAHNDIKKLAKISSKNKKVLNRSKSINKQ